MVNKYKKSALKGNSWYSSLQPVTSAVSPRDERWREREREADQPIDQEQV